MEAAEPGSSRGSQLRLSMLAIPFAPPGELSRLSSLDAARSRVLSGMTDTPPPHGGI
jgi:hypothetical protein